jgi:uroporphyrinogen-III decarboxylase
LESERDKFLRNMSLEGEPEVHSHIHIWYQVWQEFGNRLKWLENSSPYVSVGISRESIHKSGSEMTDIWGCGWLYPLESHDGLCIKHPVSSWADLKSYNPPDPDNHTNWKKAKENIERSKAQGKVAHGGTDHGFIFLRLTYLRGFQNLMIDMADNRSELNELIGIVEDYWFQVVSRWIELGVDAIGFGDDLGLQNALPISPEAWRRYIKPSYKRIFSHCRSNGVHVFLHSDGYIVDIIPDLIECGVSRLNPQDLVNGLDNLARLAKGKVFLHLDIDRQNITVFGSPQEIESHIYNCIKTLGSVNGGLSLIWYVFPPTPIQNIEAGYKAMDKYATYWRQKA